MLKISNIFSVNLRQSHFVRHSTSTSTVATYIFDNLTSQVDVTNFTEHVTSATEKNLVTQRPKLI